MRQAVTITWIKLVNRTEPYGRSDEGVYVKEDGTVKSLDEVKELWKDVDFTLYWHYDSVYDFSICILYRLYNIKIGKDCECILFYRLNIRGDSVDSDYEDDNRDSVV